MMAVEFIIARYHDGTLKLTGWGLFIFLVLASTAAANVVVRR